MENEWVNKKVKISLSNGTYYYKGLVLGEGKNWIKLRDIKNNIVFVKFSAIDVIEEWNG